MKKTALATVIALATSGAHALGPTATIDLEVFAAGAGTVDGSFGNHVASLCSAGTLDSYFDIAGSSPGSLHRAFSCTVPASNVPGLSGDLNVLVHKRSEGGSGQGIVPVARSLTQEHMVVSSGNCTDQGSNVWHCVLGGANVSNEVPDLGVSTFEPALAFGPNTADGQPVNLADVAALDSEAVAGVGYSPVVTHNLRNSLQAALGLSVGDETLANMPNLTTSQLASLFTSRYKNWDQFTINGTALTAFAGVTPPSNLNVRICRDETGGDNGSTWAGILNASCNVAATSPSATSGFGGPVVTKDDSAGEIEDCLTNHDAAGNWAAGSLSTERNANLSKDYRFVKLDGVATTIENIAGGRTTSWTNVWYNWRNATSGDAASGDTLAYIQQLAATASSASAIASSNASHVHSWGNGGSVALPGGGNSPDAAGQFASANPVSPYIYQGGNSCNTPTPQSTTSKVPL